MTIYELTTQLRITIGRRNILIHFTPVGRSIYYDHNSRLLLNIFTKIQCDNNNNMVLVDIMVCTCITCKEKDSDNFFVPVLYSTNQLSWKKTIVNNRRFSVIIKYQ